MKVLYDSFMDPLVRWSRMNESYNIWKNYVYTWMSHGTCEWVIYIYEWAISQMNKSFMYTNESHHKWMSHIYISMSHITYEWVRLYMNESWHTWWVIYIFEWVMSHMNKSFVYIEALIPTRSSTPTPTHTHTGGVVEKCHSKDIATLLGSISYLFVLFQILNCIVFSIVGIPIRIHTNWNSNWYYWNS